MRTFSRILLAAATFAAVAFLPDFLGSTGSTGASSDLGLSRLLAQGSLLAFVIAFAGGVLTSLTPCVYPLIPITVSVFGARKAGSRGQAVALSLLYVVFAAMAASMFGAFELQLPASLQGKLAQVGGAGFAGAFAMGLVAGVVAAPCTGPVLAAALTWVATRGSAVYGFGIMFTYALGLGLLFFLIGAFSISLPKSGPWMDTVKSVFGVALLAAAGVFLKDAFPAVKPLFLASRAAALAAAGACALGVLMGALVGSFHAPTSRRFAKGAGVALLVLGVVYAAGAGNARRAAAEAKAPFPWEHDEPAALVRARAEGRPVIIDFWADWCSACKELDHLAWADPRVREEAKRFVTLKMDGSADDPSFEAAFKKYAVVGMPTVILIDPRGRELPERITAAIDAQAMLSRLREVDQACGRAPGALACVARW